MALARELAEELDIAVEIGEPLTFAVHEEAGLRILLLFFEAAIRHGAPILSLVLETAELRLI